MHSGPPQVGLGGEQALRLGQFGKLLVGFLVILQFEKTASQIEFCFLDVGAWLGFAILLLLLLAFLVVLGAWLGLLQVGLEIH